MQLRSLIVAFNGDPAKPVDADNSAVRMETFAQSKTMELTAEVCHDLAMSSGNAGEGGVPQLRGTHVLLRAPRDGDVQDRVANGQHPEIVRMYGGAPTGAIRAVSCQEALDWVDGLRQHPHAWVIDYRGRCAGEIRLDRVDGHDRRASLAIGLQHPDLLGHGFGTDAMWTLLRYAFGELGLHRVGLRVLAINARAIAAYRKVGFVMEGRERESALVDGAWLDDLIMGILAKEFLSLDRAG